MKCYIKLTDFGLATPLQGETAQRQLECNVGTLPYKAPEMLRNERYDEKVDIWAAGVIAYQLFTGGDPPFYDDDEDEFKRQILDDDPDMEAIENPMAKQFIIACLNKDPSKRPSAKLIARNPFFDRHTWTSAQSSTRIQVGKQLVRFGKMSFLQKRLVSFIANILQESDDMKEMRRLFLEIDDDKDGAISIEEMREGIPKLGTVI